MNERKGAWYLLTGVVLGLALGLVYSLWISPVEFARVAPQSLGQSYKDGYRILIAQAYAADGDIGRAQARLALLDDVDPAAVLTAQAQRVMADGGRADDARALDALGEDLEVYLLTNPTPQPSNSPASPADDQAQHANTASGESTAESNEEPLQTATPENTEGAPAENTPRPSAPSGATPRATSLPDEVTNAAFVLSEQYQVCDLPESETQGRYPALQIEVLDEEGIPLPGVAVHVDWPEGEDSFYTGLQPQVSPGYADFRMTAGVYYSVQIGSRGEIVSDLDAVMCETEEGEMVPGGLWLTFKQP